MWNDRANRGERAPLPPSGVLLVSNLGHSDGVALAQPTVPLMSAGRAGLVLIKLSAGARATITRLDRHCQPPSQHLQKLVHSELHLVIALVNIKTIFLQLYCSFHTRDPEADSVIDTVN